MLRYQYFNDGIKSKKKIALFDFDVTTCKTTQKWQKEGHFTTPVPVDPEKDMNQVTKFLKSISSGEDIIYRGHADSEWKLIPSIGRYFTGLWGKVVEREKKSLDEFKKRAIPYLKYTPKSDIEWLCLMQHHGCSTRLLDFTSNPLIALFFATDPSIKKDGEVIVAKYGLSHENVSNEKLFERTHDFAYFPPHITERIIGQFGSFVY